MVHCILPLLTVVAFWLKVRLCGLANLEEAVRRLHAEYRIEHQAFFWQVFRDAAESASSRTTAAGADAPWSSIPDEATGVGEHRGPNMRGASRKQSWTMQ